MHIFQYDKGKHSKWNKKEHYSKECNEKSILILSIPIQYDAYNLTRQQKLIKEVQVEIKKSNNLTLQTK